RRQRVLQENVVVTMAVEMEEHSAADTLAAEVDVLLDADDVRRRLSPR
ncbi:MAG: hypothetical protein JO148_07375, partial [Acidimicrobiia bacterium]|nr:hypothetical protein [Acidimicrobiia bacterium]